MRRRGIGRFSRGGVLFLLSAAAASRGERCYRWSVRDGPRLRQCVVSKIVRQRCWQPFRASFEPESGRADPRSRVQNSYNSGPAGDAGLAQTRRQKNARGKNDSGRF